jgi:hypothetical protein
MEGGRTDDAVRCQPVRRIKPGRLETEWRRDVKGWFPSRMRK